MADFESEIIKSPEADIMLSYIPRDFYAKSFEALWIFEVIGREWDDLSKWSEELYNETSIQKCTWSIGLWEETFGIEPDEILPLEKRRINLLAKKLSRPPATPYTICRAAKALTGSECFITENTAPYTFDVTIKPAYDSQNDDYDAAYKRICSLKPSHLRARININTERTFRFVIPVKGLYDVTFDLNVPVMKDFYGVFRRTIGVDKTGKLTSTAAAGFYPDSYYEFRRTIGVDKTGKLTSAATAGFYPDSYYEFRRTIGVDKSGESASIATTTLYPDSSVTVRGPGGPRRSGVFVYSEIVANLVE